MEKIIKVIEAFLKPICSNPGAKDVCFKIRIEKSKREGEFIVTETRIISIEFFPSD